MQLLHALAATWIAVRAELAVASGQLSPRPVADAADAWFGVERSVETAYALLRRAEVRVGGTRLEEASARVHLAHRAGQRNLLTASPAVRDGSGDALAALTRREREVLGLLIDGCTNREISAALFITEKTAGSHVSSILGKLGVTSRLHAVSIARRGAYGWSVR